MLQKNLSGQYLYFSLLSVTSGTVITGASGSISGRKSLDGLSGMIVLSGYVIELGGGSYRANLYDFDTNGNYAGYLFTASNAVPVQYSLVTMGGVSGAINLASGSITSGLIASGIVFPTSGAFVNTPPATLSGVVVNSGVFVTVPIATISGNISNSGLFVTAPPATLSGVVVNSGLFVTVPIATISGAIANSGLFATVPPATLSGVVANSGLNVEANVVRWLTKAPRALVGSGHVDGFPSIDAGTVRSGTANTVQLLTTAGEGTSGILDGCAITIVEGTAKGQSRVIRNWGSSGIALIDPPWDVVPEDSTQFYIVTPTTRTASGVEYPALPKAAMSGIIANSGLFVTATAVVESGVFVTVPKETLSGVVANSGLFVNATATVNSGLSVIATLYSGSLNSGQMVQLHSGQSVIGTLYSGTLSGTQHVNAFSGVNAIVPKETLSGIIANSGIYATVPIATISGNISNSGLFVTVLPATISGVTVNSGLFVTVPIATISGNVGNSGIYATVLPENLSGVFGTASLNSGQFTLVYSGQLSGQQVTARTVTDKSGYVIGTNLDKTDYLIISGNLSGQIVVPASGAFVTADLLSGRSVLVYSGQLSGQLVTAASGAYVTAEVGTKTGFTLASSGLDAVTIETNLNARQALAVIGASVAGKLSGAGTANITMAGAGVSTERIAGVCDASGNRTSVTITPPS